MKSVAFKHVASIALLGFMLLLAYGSSDSSSTRSGSSKRSSAPSGQSRISGDNWTGCTDREYFSKLIGYAAQNDTQAFSQALAAGILRGVCTRFTSGEEVFIADTAVFSGLVKVRRKGETVEYWTNLEAVD